MGLDKRHRHVGLAPTTPLPPNARQAAVIAVLLQGFVGVQWSTDRATAKRVLAYLKADLNSAETGGGGDAR